MICIMIAFDKSYFIMCCNVVKAIYLSPCDSYNTVYCFLLATLIKSRKQCRCSTNNVLVVMYIYSVIMSTMVLFMPSNVGCNLNLIIGGDYGNCQIN